MSQLQLGLLILGGLLLLAMAAYNLWLWRKNQPRQAVLTGPMRLARSGRSPHWMPRWLKAARLPCRARRKNRAWTR
jgi:hypothetical protein